MRALEPDSPRRRLLPGASHGQARRPRAARLLLALALLGCACAPAAGNAPAGGPARSATAGSSPPAPSVVAAPPAATVAAPVALTVGAVNPNANIWTTYIGISQGFFEQAGVQVELTYTGSTANTTQQVVAGAIDLGNGSIDNYVRAVEAGAPIVVVAGEQTMPTYGLIGQPSVATVADLRGKLLIISAAKDPTAYFLQQMLRPNGLADGDYDLTFAGGTSDRFAALQAGAVAAAILTQPFDFAAERLGYRRLVSQWDYPIDYQFVGYGVRRDWAAAHEDALVRYLRGFGRAHRWLHDPSHREEAIVLLSEAVKLQPEDASATYDLLITRLKVLAPDGQIAEKDVRGVLDSLIALGDLVAPPPPVSKYLDNRYIDAARRP
jgi:ABC-type nitrate/sulfonate/bicarbonate transport system substrate-binding protein